MSAYLEAVMHTENQLENEAKRERAIHDAVMACLDVIDSEYPQFKKSSGPFGDKLASALHKRIEDAFEELGLLEAGELEELAKLNRKYRA